MRRGAFAWLLVVAVAALYLAWRVAGGIELQTDLLALLPQEERDGSVQRAKQRMADAFGRRIVLLVGHEDREAARKAAIDLVVALDRSGMASVQAASSADARQLGEIFFASRAGLLTVEDRRRLGEGREREIVNRALAALFGPVGIADAQLLRHDPFLLAPTYLSVLPMPLSRVVIDEGMLTVADSGKIWIVVTAQLGGDVFAMSFQKDFVAVVNAAERRVSDVAPGSIVLRSGAVFYAHAGAAVANRETTVIGLVSALGTIVLILVVFRALRPLWFNLLALAVGILCAFSASLWLFGALHVGALLFGVSLIGVAVDYSLHYACEGLGEGPSQPGERIRRVLPGIALGLATTLVGYLALLLAPLPGLHQLAAFSVIGLCASFLTVVLWLPLLDGDKPSRHAILFLSAASGLWRFWEEARFQRTRRAMLVGLGALAALGATMLTVDDDVRRLQTLPGALKRQEAEIRRLTGSGNAAQFFLVTGADHETVLQREETLLAKLDAAHASGALTQVHALAQIVPSQARQRENHALIREKLSPLLPGFYRQIGLLYPPDAPYREEAFLTPEAIARSPALSFFRTLVIDDGSGVAQLVLIDGVARPEEVRKAGDGIAGVAFVDPTGDFSRLFGQYRHRSILLLVLSAALMMPLLFWRYGLGGAFRVLLPTAVALLLTPLLVALGGAPFTFFNAIALVLVLAISIDYAIFCREARLAGRAATMLGICLATLTTILSFGLLALSSVYGVHAFGMTLAVGISLAFVLSPLAGKPALASPVAGGAR